MAGLPVRFLLFLLVTLGVVRSADAQIRDATPAEQQFAAIEARYAPNPTAPATNGGVQQVAFTGTGGSPAGPTLPPPNPVAPVVAPNSASIYPATSSGTEVIIPPSGPFASDAWCMPPQELGRTSSWTAAIELIPSRPRVTDFEFGRWDDDSTLALRLILGYEDPEGLGVRARFWGLTQDADTPAGDVELDLGMFQLDFYKRLFLDGGEIALGAGPASSRLEFDVPGFGHSRFEGAGGTVFFDGYYGLLYFDRSDLGAVVRARHSILLGDWRDTTGGLLISRTDNDTMSISELAWGLEYRRRFGKCEDHSWFVGLLAEYQRWQSDWMSNTSGTSVGVSGLNIYTGLNW
jgi:hypothetical protein